MDDDVTSTATLSIRGSKKPQYLDLWEKTKKKVARNSALTRPVAKIGCEHGEESFCQAATLQENDLNDFRRKLDLFKTAVEQNNFVTKFLIPYSPVRKRPRTENPRSRTSIQYNLRKKDVNLVIVCQKTFLSVTGLGPTRIRNLGSFFLNAGKSRPENRGGNRQQYEDLEVTDSMVEHISSFPVTESHYGCGKSSKQYLSHHLSVAKMFGFWKSERLNKNLPVASLSKYKRIFLDKFNLGFGCPKADVCSRCILLRNKIKANIDKEESKLELRLHTLRAKKFSQILAAERDERHTLAISFDMEQNQPFPKLNVTETFYARQLWVYNLTFVIHERSGQKRKNVFIYTWNETQSGKGSNEIVSALSNFLRRIKRRVLAKGYTKLALFTDSCGGQNKNKSMLMFLLRYVNSEQNVFRRVEYYFPIRGHSYMPPDRVFGRIEKQLRRREVMKTPQEYHKIFEKHGKLKVLNKDWQVFDYKSLATALYWPSSPLKTRGNRVWVFKPNFFTVSTCDTYFGLRVPAPVLKLKYRNTGRLCGSRPKLLLNKSHVSEAKAKDVCALLSYCDLTLKEEAYFGGLLDQFDKKILPKADKPKLRVDEKKTKAVKPKPPSSDFCPAIASRRITRSHPSTSHAVMNEYESCDED